MGAKKKPLERESHHDTQPQPRWCRVLMFLATMDNDIACLLIIAILSIFCGILFVLFKAVSTRDSI